MTREPAFKRAAKAQLSIRATDLGEGLRKLLTARIQPLVAYLVSEMAELAARRFEQELERMCEGLEVAVSAFVSEVASEPTQAPRETAEDWLALMNTPGRARSVWTVATQPYRGAHFATFPPKLIKPCILAGSRPGDIVLDTFFGSGTVGMVAEQLGRRWIGFDINPAYEALQRERIARGKAA